MPRLSVGPCGIEQVLAVRRRDELATLPFAHDTRAYPPTIDCVRACDFEYEYEFEFEFALL